MFRSLFLAFLSCSLSAIGQSTLPNPLGVVTDGALFASGEREHVIDGVVAKLNDSYIDLAVAKTMSEALLAHQKRGDYDLLDQYTFAAQITEDLQDVSHDKHLRVRYSSSHLPADRSDLTPDEQAQRRADLESANCGFEQVRILSDNIAYIKFNLFGPPDLCGPTVAAAMGFVAHARALIFDVSENRGGAPAMVDMIASYLFDKRTHLNDLYNRQTNETTQYWTLPHLAGMRLPNLPVFVLTSKMTFSGAEEFCYDLQALKRATIVGEVTAGGAHPIHAYRISDHFSIDVPSARAVNPITKTDWEGTGVIPDVNVIAYTALDTARDLASKTPRSGPASRTAGEGFPIWKLTTKP